MTETDAGTLEILNVGTGGITIALTGPDAIEAERFRRMVTDMLRRGYALFVERDKAFIPVKAFDPEALSYLVSDVPGVDLSAVAETPPTGEARCWCGRKKGHTGLHSRKGEKEIPARKAKTVAVHRSAGG
jgi:hypothetical protein